jgi:hypothetical protein
LCFNASAAVILKSVNKLMQRVVSAKITRHALESHYRYTHISLGFFFKSDLIKSFASWLMWSHSSEGKLNSPIRILSKISLSGKPSKGGYPHKVMYVITPIDHMSQLFV